MTEHQSFEDHCRGAISLVPVYFSIVSGQVRTQSDASLQTIVSHLLHQLADIHSTQNLDLAVLATPAAEAAILRAIYDADTLPLVLTRRWATETNHQAVALLDPQQKARLLAEGIAGAVAIAAQIAAQCTGRVTLSGLTHELHRFAASPRPQHIRDVVEHSHLFSECLMMSQILDLIMRAAHDDHLALKRKVATFDDYSADVFCSDQQRSTARNMGMPWGLEFMVLN
ncbi:hypothetical protein SCUCBS95973_006679 [Sporothrix curviconia]|uniref:Uncharacterized protein n=1 Tax=Sporothrix curviconia TaxID=1260050 RepID=A0ABP0C759_9PEZI